MATTKTKPKAKAKKPGRRRKGGRPAFKATKAHREIVKVAEIVESGPRATRRKAAVRKAVKRLKDDAKRMSAPAEVMDAISRL